MYLDPYIKKITKLCEDHNVRYLFAFGSVITDSFSEYSDIDLVVDINATDPFDYAERYFSLKFSLEDLLHRSIDLLEYKGLKNKYLIKNINNTKKLLYEA